MNKTFDATIISQKILSCVYRVEERFGINYIASILIGSKEKDIIKNKHKDLTTYGIVNDFSKTQLKILIKELINLGCITLTHDRYPILKLNKKSRLILTNKEKVNLHVPSESFVLWLESVKKDDMRGAVETVSLFKQGFTIEEVINKRKLKRSSIINHLEKALIRGENIDISNLVNPDRYKIINKTFDKIGIQKLSRVKEDLGDDYNYDEIKLVRAKMIKDINST